MQSGRPKSARPETAAKRADRPAAVMCPKFLPLVSSQSPLHSSAAAASDDARDLRRAITAPMSFMRFFKMAGCGARVLLCVVEFCDAQTARVLASLFPAAARRDETRRPAPAKGRQLCLSAVGRRGNAVNPAGTRRRVLVETKPPPQRMVRAQTTIKRYSPPQHQQKPQKQQQQQRQGALQKGRARTPEKLRFFSPLKRTATLMSLPTRKTVCEVLPVRPHAARASPPVAECDPNELSMTVCTAPRECTSNKFSRLDGTINGVTLSDVGYFGNTLTLSGSKESAERSESPPPRFPPFSQFLDEQESALLLQNHYGHTSNSHHGEAEPRAAPNAMEKIEKELKVVELGPCVRVGNSAWTCSPNPATPRPLMNSPLTLSCESSKRRRTCKPPPQLRIVPKDTSLSVSQRQPVAKSKSFTTATTTTAGITENTPTTTARTSGGTKTTAENKSNSNGSFLSLFSRRRVNTIIESGGSSANRGTHAMRGQLTASSNLAKYVSPRPFSSGTSLAASCSSSRVFPAGGRGAVHNPVSRTAQGFTTESRAPHKKTDFMSPRFERRATQRTFLMDGVVSRTARPHAVLSEGEKTRRATPLTARPLPARRLKTSALLTSRARTPPKSSVAQTSTASRACNLTPQGTGTRLPLRRIESSRLLPTSDSVCRYVPLMTDVRFMEQPLPPPPSLLTMLHITRRPKSKPTD